ncbi:DapH/DapD/GlmU-related protein [Flavimaricola marinus]|uniref:Putative acetyltransferase n=1 Tax=Flavimaricola marinus TaxID=1819565 RepID=A0A238LAK1_9RHOB|nr:DapH/DapD/GlmU-related protein [Flavimaricola marinus]SMY06747.1 Putative acetyltransferase [Flavimaricola marinus]
MGTYDDMLAGKPHKGNARELDELKQKAAAAKARLDAIPDDDLPARMEAAADLFAEGSGPFVLISPFTIQFGRHVRIGEMSFVNRGATFLDGNTITIGNRVAVGPNVQFITDTHPLRPEDRFPPPEPEDDPPFRVINIALPIVVEDEAWIGAGAIILPGVTVGNAAVVGAGAVVTKDVAPRTVVAGNPARVLRSVDD